MSRSGRPGLSIWGYAIAVGVFGYGAGVLWTGSSAQGAVLGLVAAAAVIAVLVGIEVRRGQ